MSRWSAFAIHFFISTGILLGLALFMLATWYGDGIWRFSRASELWLIVALVDIIVGPLLTLLIFRPGKPHLRFDISCIVLMQISFLGWGLMAVWESRPIFVVAQPHKLTLIFANDIPTDDLFGNDSSPSTPTPWLSPKLVGVKMPAQNERADEFLVQSMLGRDLTTFPDLYVPYSELRSALLKNTATYEMLHTRLAPADQKRLQALVAEDKRPDFRWIPITSSRGNGVMALDLRDAEPVSAYDFDLPAPTPSLTTQGER